MNYLNYSTMNGINISSLVPAMLLSPKHYKHQLDHQRTDTAAMRLGRLVHTAVLEPMRLPKDYVVSDFDSFRTKAAQEWRKTREEAGQTVVTAEQYRAAERMREEVMACEQAARHLIGGRPEWAIQWIDDDTGLQCKGRVDYIGKALVDLKTTRHVAHADFARDAARMHYHTRMAWYLDGIEAVTHRRPPVVIIAIQTEEPFDVGVYRMPDAALAAGREIYKGLLRTLQQCRATGVWPGACAEETELALPTWAIGREETMESITVGGVPLF